jgi:hypothetical protein
MDLVQDEHRADPASVCGEVPRGIPLLRDPFCAAQQRFISARVSHRRGQPVTDLLDERGLAHLARTREDLNEAARFGEPARQHSGLGSPVGEARFAHVIE